MPLFILVSQLIRLWERAPITSFQVPFIINQPAAHSLGKRLPTTPTFICSQGTAILQSKFFILGWWVMCPLQTSMCSPLRRLPAHQCFINPCLIKPQRFAVSITPGICEQEAFLYSTYTNVYFPLVSWLCTGTYCRK